MLPDRVSNPGPLTYESGALSIALRGPGDITDILARKYLVRFIFLDKNRKKIICPTDLDRKFADH